MSDAFFAGSYGGNDHKLSDNSRLECKICWTIYDPAQPVSRRELLRGKLNQNLDTEQ